MLKDALMRAARDGFLCSRAQGCASEPPPAELPRLAGAMPVGVVSPLPVAEALATAGTCLAAASSDCSAASCCSSAAASADLTCSCWASSCFVTSTCNNKTYHTEHAGTALLEAHALPQSTPVGGPVHSPMCCLFTTSRLVQAQQ